MQQKAICFFLSIHFKIFGRAFFYVCLHGLIWAAETPEFFKIVETGDTLSAEGQDWIISPTDAGFTVPLIDEFGNTVFITHIQQTLQDPAIPSIWSINREGVATLIARWGQIAPGLDLEFESFSGLNAKGNGIIVFLATLREDPRGPALNLFKATPQGITLLARQGDPAPGFGSASNLLGAPKPAQLNNAGQVAYLAPVSSSPYNGVYLDDLRIGPESADLVAGVLLRPTDPYLGNGGKVAMTASASGGFSQITGIFSGNPADGLKAKPVNSANYASISTTMTPGIEGGTFWDPSIVSYGWDNHMVVTSQVLEPGHIGQLRRGIWTGQPDTLELLVFPEFASPLEGYSFMGGVGEISIVNPGAQIFSTNVSKGLLGEPDYEEKTILIDKTYPAGSEEVVLTVGDFIGINEADGKPSMEKFRSVDAILPSRFDVAINTTTSQDGSNLISDTLWIYSYRPNKKLRSLVRSRIDYSGIGIPRGIYTTPSTNRESGDPSSINRKGQMVFGLDMGSGKIDGIFAYDVPLSILQFDPIYPEESQKDVDPFTPVVATINPGTSEFQNFDIEFQVNGSPVPFAILPKENGTFQVSYQPGEPLSLGQEQTINLWAWHELEDEVEKSWNFTTTANPPPESAEVGVKDIQFENGQVTFTITGGEAPFSFQASEFLDEWATIAEQDDRQLTLPLLDNLPFLRAEDIVSDQRVFEFKEVSPSSSDAEIIGTITIQGREILLDLGYENLDSTQLKAIVQTQDEAEAPLYINLTSLVENSTPGRIEGTIALDPSLSGFLTNTPFARLSLREQNEEITEFEFVIEKPTFPKPVLQGPSAASEPLVNDLPTEATCKYACNDDCAGVILSTGEYTHTFNLMPIAGRGEINFSVDLFYRSRVEGPFGQWNWRYQECLNEQENGDVVRYDGRGHLRSWIKQQDGSYQPPTGHFGTLIKMEDGSFILRMPNGFKRYYDQQGRLFKYKDRFGNEMRFFFDADGQVAYILDAYDRRYDIFRDSHGNITRIQDFSGRSLWFQYDENNYLTEIITPRIVGTSTGNDFPRGRRYRCGYLSGFEGDQAFLNGNLSSLTFPNEVASGGPPAYTCTYDQNPTSPTFDHLMSYTAGGTNASGIPAGGTATFAYESVNQGVPPG
ncbi:MAG: hypothetical protein KJT03_08715, partial [Verrucomicrobiae bacterium]|nr:hypothetical protein [Verrucomicrobiae bacterium]